jgi:hypothetical protein
MSTGPKGERRPADVIGCAVHVMKVATGEIEETGRDAAKEYMRQGGLKGGKARAAKLSAAKRKAIAKKAARARWGKRQRLVNTAQPVHGPSR